MNLIPPNRYLIIGNGAAGATAAETIRDHDPSGEITVISAEPYPAYSRPGLAYVLINEIPESQVFTRDLAWYARFNINLVFGRATAIDTQRKRVVLQDGRALPYHRLLIATGARATPAAYPGADLDGVVYLDDLDGTRKLIRKAKRKRRAVVVGGGITALELVEGFAHRGVETHYFVRRNRLWSSVFNDSEAGLLEERMRSHGVEIHYNREISEIIGRRGKVRAVRLKEGAEFGCDLVGVAIGVKPQLDFVVNSPIHVDRSILVNEFMQSNVPDIFAAGDCAQVYDRWTQRHMVDLLWPSAVAQGRAAGLSMAGYPQRYVKGVPLNACLLFGLHVTTMGQINPAGDGSANGDSEEVQHLSRGSSEVWYTYPRHFHCAYSSAGHNSIRLVLNGENLVGALVIGDQSLSDTLLQLITDAIDIGDLLPHLHAGGDIMSQALARIRRQLNGNGKH